jgi:hypothetical protein
VDRSRSFYLRPRGKSASPVRYAGLAILAGAVLAILGPFGTYLNGGAAELFAYWIGAMLAGVALYGAGFRMVSSLAVTGSRKWWVALVVMTLLASIPEALVTRGAAFWIWPALSEAQVPFPLWFAQTAVIGLIAMTVVGVALHRSASVSHDPVVPLPSPEPAAINLGADVLALQMEDHYVRVHRPKDSELILLPLSRAIEALTIEGLQTHRSWWVARGAVKAVEGNARSMRLRLSNGVVAPVARTAVARLKAAGWVTN